MSLDMDGARRQVTTGHATDDLEAQKTVTTLPSSSPSSPPEPTAEEYLRSPFLSKVAHDIRGPAGVVYGALEQIEGGLPPAVLEQHRALFMMARRGVKRLLRMADRFATVAQIEGGRLGVNRARVDAVALLAEVTEEAGFLQGRRAVKVTVAPSEGPLTLQADSTGLRGALLELVGNAIRMAEKNVLVSVTSDDAAVDFVVEDDGPGLPGSADEDLLFRRFPAAKEVNDYVMPLSVARDLVTRQGAELLLEASSLPPGRDGRPGLRVVIHVPRNPAINGDEGAP